MPTLQKKYTDLLKLKKAGGNDATMLVLNKIYELEEQLEVIEQRLNYFEKLPTEKVPDDVRVERIALRLANKLAQLEKGEKGEKPTQEELLALIRPLIPPPANDGHTPTDEELLSLLKPLIPIVKDGKNADEVKIIEKLEQDLPKLGMRIRDALELLNGDDRLNKEAVKGLKEEFEKLEKRITSIPRGTIGGGKKIIYTKVFDLSAQVDGTKKVFDLPERVLKVQMVWCTQFPRFFRPTVDFTATDLKVTFTDAVVAPELTQSVFALCELLFYSK